MYRLLLTVALAAGGLCLASGCKDETPKGVKDGAFQAKPLANPKSPGGGASATGAGGGIARPKKTAGAPGAGVVAD